MEVGEAPHSNLYHGYLVNPKAIEAKFQSVGADVNWSSIVVVGKGGVSHRVRVASGHR